MSVGDLAEAINGVLRQCHLVQRSLAHAVSLIEEARDNWAHATTGTQDPDASVLPGYADEAATRCTAVDDTLKLLGERLGAYLASIGASSTELDSPSPSTSTAHGPVPVDTATRDSDERRLAAARTRVGRGTAKTQATGEWLHSDGWSTRVTSGTRDQHHGSARDYLAARFPRPVVELARHVEVKIAVALNQSTDDHEATVVMDRQVCGTREFDRRRPITCDKFLPRILEPGKRLRVVEPDGTMRTYHGRLIENDKDG